MKLKGQRSNRKLVFSSWSIVPRAKSQEPRTNLHFGFWLLGFAFCLAGGSFAQSFFNPLGLGEVVAPAFARSNALGSPSALSPANPGVFLNISKTNLNISLLTGTTIGKQRNNTRAIGTVRPIGLYGAVPLPTRTRILIGIEQRFGQDFDLWSESLANTTRYHITSRGGIYSLNAGVAQSFLSHFAIGAQFHQLWGSSREEWQFHAPEGSIAADTMEILYSGTTARIGFSASFLRSTLSIIYDPPLTLTTRRFKHIHGVTTDSIRTYSIKLPHTIALGAATDRLWQTRINLGLELRPWSGSRIDEKEVGYRNVWRGCIGLEYELFPNHPLRLGYSMGSWYCAPRSPLTTLNPVTEKGAHLGTGIPIPNFGALDIAGELLFRKGETPSGPLGETAARLILTLSYEETWAKRIRRWGY